MPDLANRIIAALAQPGYQPLKPKALARKLGIGGGEAYEPFKRALRELLKQGRVEMAKGNTVRQTGTHGTVTGTFRKATAGFGFVRLHPSEGHKFAEVFIPAEAVADAATGDLVLVKIRRKPSVGQARPTGEIVQVLERTTRQFVGSYFEREGQALVRVDGTVFAHSIDVGDPGAKGAQPGDKVVIEMVRFPSPQERGAAVIVEILGPRGAPGVDTLSVIRAFGLPDEFPEEVLAEARQAAAEFSEDDLHGRDDCTGWLTLTIDPVDARDFDDAVSLTLDPKSKHWLLGVHIADVSHFASLGGALDLEARRRGTSVYLPQRVLPMFPEIISNGLASLQQDQVRYVKSALIDYTPAGQVAEVRFANAAIKVRQRFTYEQVTDLLQRLDRHEPVELAPEIVAMLLKMRELALLLHQRRLKRGALELLMPEPELEYDREGHVTGAHFRSHDISHQIIEEFMLAANGAVADRLDRQGVDFLRRVHPVPDPLKLEAFGAFARILGYKLKKSETDRFTLQRTLQESAERPERHAVHYALLRSLKQAHYSPEKDEHFALAIDNYCHFTSPIRRYPDLVVHRLLDQILRRGHAGANFDELRVLGEHCSKTERRADMAERELVRHKLLVYMSERIGADLAAVITGVADYGFYAQAQDVPIEGLVHISTLPDDYYYHDEAAHSLIGQRTQRVFRLGDKVTVTVVRVDMQRRQLDFRVKEGRSRRGPM
jgi:ribonuclease R